MLKKIAGIIALTGAISATAQADTWHMPTPYGDANLTTKLAYEFADEIREKSGGKLDINVHSGASLIKHPEIPRAVRTGQVQLGEVFIGVMGNSHPVFKHDNIPFLATNFDDSKKLWEAAKPELEKLLNKEGMVLLYTVPWPTQSLYTKFPVNTLDDLKGTKMRAYSPSTSRLAELMHTSPTTVQAPEVPQAFSTGIIDAMITSPSTGANGQAWDYLTHYTDIKAWIPKNIVVANKRAFRRLDKATQQMILTAAANAESKGWEGVRATTRQDTETLAANGIVVSEPSAELIAELEKIGQIMIKEWEAEAPAEIGKILKQYQQQ
ncbi:TRAP transporter substrate-binding protein [Marinobacterium marinum]|uniref:TRAP transporter substrate-binding protein n=1 Tax=Marinobacterium marinum TaxID=2756129 RepID=A0A7W2ABK2_9GAMM|nr:TRAP transporter substrate-binding protein [Marinobacterium marinum]MBA4503021.1 TRAP transporter substrate-binding protein [Marinobacterium marinum]